VLLRVDGGAGWLSGAEQCAACSAWSVDVGASFAYHLSQAIAIDPWISYGLAYRHSLATAAAQEQSYSGLDLLRVGIGSDFYPLPSFGFGPYIEGHVGMRLDGDAPAYGLLHGGLRVSFDPLRWGTTLRPRTATLRSD